MNWRRTSYIFDETKMMGWLTLALISSWFSKQAHKLFVDVIGPLHLFVISTIVQIRGSHPL